LREEIEITASSFPEFALVFAANSGCDSISVSIVGGLDGSVSRPFGESVEMAERLGTSAHFLDDCGHSATLEQPETVNALLAGFLEAIN